METFNIITISSSFCLGHSKMLGIIATLGVFKTHEHSGTQIIYFVE